MVGIGSDSDCVVVDMNNERLSIGDIITPALRNDTEYLIVGGNMLHVFVTNEYVDYNNNNKTTTLRLGKYNVSKNYIKKQKDKPLVIWQYKS